MRKPAFPLILFVLLALGTDALARSVEACAVETLPDLERAFEQRDLAPVRAWLGSCGEALAETPDVLRVRAWLARREQLTDEAVELLARAIEQDPSRAALYFDRAAMQREQLERTGGLKALRIARRLRADLETALELDPEHPATLEALYAFHRRAPGIVGGSDRRAEELAERLRQVDPARLLHRHAMRLRNEDREAAIDSLRRALALVERAPAEWRMRLARLEAEVGNADAALAALEPLVSEAALHPPALNEFGRIAAETGQRLREALGLLEDYLTREPWPGDPGHGEAWWHKARVLAALGERERALEALKCAQRENPALEFGDLAVVGRPVAGVRTG
ncbi:MAG: tetratricopeptide repeat protein [Wenzhouxiangellaceae bacterium]|nr:tetratricopeptide repeat protein [Wenzhouxiangellaceae bacterium]